MLLTRTIIMKRTYPKTVKHIVALAILLANLDRIQVIDIVLREKEKYAISNQWRNSCF